MPWFYYLVKVILRILLPLFSDWRVKGKENIPAEGAVIVVANHLNNADPPILGISLSRKAIFMAKKELFRSKLSSYLIRGVGGFPVHRGRLDREALRRAKHALSKGAVLVIFPEGKRSENAQLQPAFPGSVLIAVRNGTPILPIGIAGTEKFKGLSWLLHRPKIVVNIGRPFSLQPVEGKLTKVELSRLAETMMEHIAELLPQEYRGHYARKKH